MLCGVRRSSVTSKSDADLTEDSVDYQRVAFVLVCSHHWCLVFWQVSWYFGMWDPHCGHILPPFLPCLILSLLRGSSGGHVGGSYCITITGSRMGYYARAGTHITYFLLEFFPLTILSRTEIVLKRFAT